MNATAYSRHHRQDLEATAKTMRDLDCALVGLDCMGYGQDLQRDFEAGRHKPPLLARSLVARVATGLG